MSPSSASRIGALRNRIYCCRLAYRTTPAISGNGLDRRESNSWLDGKPALESPKPDFRATDILGALLLASQIFAQDAGSNRRVLILFSDMRNGHPDLNMENPHGWARSMGGRYPTNLIHGTLSSTDLYALGVDDPGKSAHYWEELRTFWRVAFPRPERR